MTLKRNLFIIFSGTLLAFGFWLTILFQTDPTYADILTWMAFFAALFIWLSGFLTFIIFYIKVNFYNHEIIYSLLPATARQSSEIALVVVGLMILQTLKVLGWWEGGLFILVIFLIELFFQSKPVYPKNEE